MFNSKNRRYVLALVMIGLIIRFFGLGSDFWLDEIWSFYLITGLRSPLQIFTSLFHDNNHPLNSLFMYLVGKSDPVPWPKYRLLSLVLGVGTIILTAVISVKLFPNQAVAVTAAFLTATSYPLVVYSSEAKGYSPAFFFSVLSFYLLGEYFRQRKRGLLIWFQLSFLLGFLSHFSFICIALGLAAWGWDFLIGNGFAPRRRLFEELKIFLIPSAIASVVYTRFALHLKVGGGPKYSLLDIVERCLSFLFGLPGDNLIAFGLMLIFLFALSVEIWRLAREGCSLGRFNFYIIIAAVVFLLVKSLTTGLLLVRYIFILLPFLIMAFSHLVYRLWSRGGKGRILAAGVLLVYLGGNGQRLIHFFKSGRGDYLAALSYICQHTASSVITVASDNDFRTALVLSFYERFLPPTHNLRYLPGERMGPEIPEWYISHSLGKALSAPATLSRPEGTFVLERVYPYNGELSGFNWYIYHRKK